MLQGLEGRGSGRLWEVERTGQKGERETREETEAAKYKRREAETCARVSFVVTFLIS